MIFKVIFCIAGLIASSQALTEAQIENLLLYHSECLIDTGVDMTLVNKARQGHFTPDDKFKHYLFCMSKKIGFQYEDGTFNMEHVTQKLGHEMGHDQATIDMLIAKCGLQKATPEDTAYDACICYMENTPTHINLMDDDD